MAAKNDENKPLLNKTPDGEEGRAQQQQPAASA
jgi:hypothetical protein